MMVLVDTPVWSLALRRDKTALASSELRATQILYRVIEEGRVQLLGSVRQELLSGIREQSQFERLRDYLRDFPDVEVSTEDYENAADASKRCRRAGIASTPVDMLMCAIALRHGWQVFTADRDFAHYARVLPIELASRA
jgi:predicted nucleic acid-binding protein